MVNSVTPLVNYGATAAAYATQYQSQLAFAQSHPQIVAAAQKYKVQLAEAAEVRPRAGCHPGPSGAVHPAGHLPQPGQIPPKLQAQAVAAAGGGARAWPC